MKHCHTNRSAGTRLGTILPSPSRLLRAGREAGSVLVIVMITLLFATFALIAFMEKASVDLLVEQREVLTRRLRMEGYSALEMTLGVLEQFREAGNGLRSPAEGWNDPLKFAGYLPSEGREVEVTFEDESGKISLPRANAQVLTDLFKTWGISQGDSEDLTDAMLGWMKRNHVYATALHPDYDMRAIPHEAPGRALRSFQELAAIDKVGDMFFDTDGRPNEYWKRFVDSVSLLDFQRSNLNGAKPDTLAALGQFDETQRETLVDYQRGTGNFKSLGPQVFQSPNDAGRIIGPAGNAAAFGATISALRITIIVRDGRTEFKLSTVIAPPGGATTVQATATSTRAQASGTTAQSPASQLNRPNATQVANRPAATNTAAQNAAASRNLRYPFTLLEIRENDEIPSSPPPPPPNTLI